MIYFFSLDSLFESTLPVLGAVDMIRTLVQHQERFLIITDKANRSRRQLAQYLYDAGFPLLYDEMFYTSTMAAVDAVRRNYPELSRACYIGNEALGNTLREGGFVIDLKQADWLFIGSNRNAAYRDYCDGLSLVLNGATMISVNDDVLETVNGQPCIGTGAVVTMLEAASGKRALHAGWPAPLLLRKASRYMGCEEEDVLFVSDRYQEEILPAGKAGFKTVFIVGDQNMTEDLRDLEIQPDYIVENLKGLLK